MSSFVGRGNQYIQLVKVLYCKLPTIGKQLPTFPHMVWGLNRQPQIWKVSVLPLHPIIANYKANFKDKNNHNNFEQQVVLFVLVVVRERITKRVGYDTEKSKRLPQPSNYFLVVKIFAIKNHYCLTWSSVGENITPMILVLIIYYYYYKSIFIKKNTTPFLT